MNEETLCKTIEELLKEIKNVKFINKVLISGIKSMFNHSFTSLSSIEREKYQDDCLSILRAVKMFEYKFNGVKLTDIGDKVMSLTKEELFHVDE